MVTYTQLFYLTEKERKAVFGKKRLLHQLISKLEIAIGKRYALYTHQLHLKVFLSFFGEIFVRA